MGVRRVGTEVDAALLRFAPSTPSAGNPSRNRKPAQTGARATNRPSPFHYNRSTMSDAEIANPDQSAFGIDRSDLRVRWAHEARVPWTFRFRRYLTGFILAMLPPFSGKTVIAWLWLPILVACGWFWVWYVTTRVTGARDVDVEMRWMAYICGVLILLLFVFAPSSGGEDAQRRRDPFRSGRIERTVVLGSSFAVQRGPNRWIPVRLVAIRRVRRLFGVVAIQLPSGKYWPVPKELFPSRSEWREFMDQTVGYPGR